MKLTWTVDPDLDTGHVINTSHYILAVSFGGDRGASTKTRPWVASVYDRWGRFLTRRACGTRNAAMVACCREAMRRLTLEVRALRALKPPKARP